LSDLATKNLTKNQTTTIIKSLANADCPLIILSRFFINGLLYLKNLKIVSSAPDYRGLQALVAKLFKHDFLEMSVIVRF